MSRTSSLFLLCLWLFFISALAEAKNYSGLKIYISNHQQAISVHEQAVNLLNERELELHQSEQDLLLQQRKIAKLKEEITVLDTLVASNPSYNDVLDKQKKTLAKLTQSSLGQKEKITLNEDRVLLSKKRLEKASKDIQKAKDKLEQKSTNLINEGVRMAVEDFKTPQEVTIQHVEPCSNNENLDACKIRGKATAQRLAIEQGSQSLVSSTTIIENFELVADVVDSKLEATILAPIYEVKMKVQGNNQLSWDIKLKADIQGIPSSNIIQGFSQSIQTSISTFIFDYRETIRLSLGVNPPLNRIEQSANIPVEGKSLNALQNISNKTTEKGFIQQQINQIRGNLTIDNVSEIQQDINKIKASVGDNVDFTQIDKDIVQLISKKERFNSAIKKADDQLSNKNFLGEGSALFYWEKAKNQIPRHAKLKSFSKKFNQQLFFYLETIEPKQSIVLLNQAIRNLGPIDELLNVRTEMQKIVTQDEKRQSYKTLSMTYAKREAFYAPKGFSAHDYLNKLKLLEGNSVDYLALLDRFIHQVEEYCSTDDDDIVTKQVTVLQNTIEFYPKVAGKLFPLLTKQLKKIKTETVTPQKTKKVKRVFIGGF